MRRSRLSVFFCLFSILLLMPSSVIHAAPVPLSFNEPPEIVSAGDAAGVVGTKSYWRDVGSIEGESIDMEMEILANSSSAADSVQVSTEAGSAKLSLTGEGAQSVDVAYRFYLSGTDTPIVVTPDVVFHGIDGGLRAEVIRTLASQVASYSVDSVSAITIEEIENGLGSDDDVLQFTSTAGKNLVTNSGFEEGNTGFTSSYEFLGEHDNSGDAIADWGEDRYGIFSDNRTGDSANSYFNQTLANNGDAFIIIDIGSDLVNPFWQATVELEAGKNYVFSAYLANINDSNSTIKPNVNFVLASSEGSLVLAESGDLDTGGSALTPWREFTSEFTAAGTSNTLQMIANSAGLIGNDLAMDDVVIRELLPSNEVAVQLNLQPASVFYFTFEKDDGLGEFTFDCSLPDVFMDPHETPVDNTAPATPTILTPVHSFDTTPILEGTGEAYSSISVEVADAIFEINADVMGAWRVDTATEPKSGEFNPLLDGTANHVEVYSTDEAGNTSESALGELFILPFSAQNSTITTADDRLLADGISTTSVTVEAKNSAGENIPLVGAEVELSTDLGTLSEVIDNGDGTYSSVFTSSAEAGTATISGRFNGQDLTATTVECVELSISIDPVTGDDEVDEDEERSGFELTGTTQFIEDGQQVVISIEHLTFEGTVESGAWSVSIPANALQGFSGSVAVTADVASQNGKEAPQASRTIETTNSLPTIYIPQAPSVDEDSGPFSFADDPIRISDPENEAVTVTLVVQGGQLDIADAEEELQAEIQPLEGDEQGLIISGPMDDVNSALAQLVFNPEDHFYGDARIAIACEDAADGQVNDEWVMTILAVNDAPSIGGTPPGTVKIAELYEFTPQASDIDSESLSFSAEGLPSWAAIDDQSGKISGTPNVSDVGTVGGIELSVSDGELSATLPVFSITVLPPPNSPPVAVAQALEVVENTPLDITLAASDADGDELTFAIETPPESGEVSGESASILYTPASDFVGEDQFTFSVSDGYDTVSESISITVLADLDGDGEPDVRDLDDDGDGIEDDMDVDQTGGEDQNGDGIDDRFNTPDEPGNGGVGEGESEGEEGEVELGVEDTDLDGIPDILEGEGDSDNDGDPDYLDLDSDNDGAPDSHEGGSSGLDTDNDGIDDRFDVDQTGGTDANLDGVDDAGLSDSDGDGIADIRDSDSDGDGIPDVVELGLTGSDQDGDGVDDLLDVDTTPGEDLNNDGILDAPAYADTDGDGKPNYLDADSDNDGVGDGLDNRTAPTDSDGDGITDGFDVDVTGGADANGDGVDDNALLDDNDGDGIANVFDLDSDDDGLLDSIEAGLQDDDQNGFADLGENIAETLPNSDDDADEDMFDPDSNNDGTWDIQDTDAELLDLNDDGKIDSVGDADGDGLDDGFDLDDTTRGNIMDQDRDGIPDQRDSDDDGDGIPDRVEGDEDFDADGLPNRLDRDSDGDGLSDWFESDAPLPLGTDVDQDGLDDGFDPDQQGLLDSDADGIADEFDVDAVVGEDANGDGIIDGSAYFALRDSDDDGQPDRLDTDSDNDGLSDTEENVIGVLTGLDLDRDGLDDGIDSSISNGDDVNGDGVDDSAIDLRDIDDDGLLAFRDPDSDDDQGKDNQTDNDRNESNATTGQQKPKKIKTAVRGAGSVNPLFLCLLFTFGLIRRRQHMSLRIFIGFALSLGLALGSGSALAEREDGRTFYLGGGLGMSELLPHAQGSDWDVVEHSDGAFKLFLGYQLTDRWFAELDYADLGGAGVEPLTPLAGEAQDITYQVPSLTAGVFLLNPDNRWNLFLRAGVGSIINDATGSGDIYEKNSSAQLVLGAGAEWKLTRNLFLRAEATGYDEDAKSYLLSLGYSFGREPEKPVATLQAFDEDSDEDGVPNSIDRCPDTMPGRLVDDFGCDLDSDQDGIMDEEVVEIQLKVLFDTNSTVVKALYLGEIRGLADFMHAYPDTTVEIEGHTDDVGTVEYNQRLSEARAKSVATILHEKMGIAEERIKTMGYGELRPLVDEITTEARRQNRRVMARISQDKGDPIEMEKAVLMFTN